MSVERKLNVLASIATIIGIIGTFYTVRSYYDDREEENTPKPIILTTVSKVSSNEAVKKPLISDVSSSLTTVSTPEKLKILPPILFPDHKAELFALEIKKRLLDKNIEIAIGKPLTGQRVINIKSHVSVERFNGEYTANIDYIISSDKVIGDVIYPTLGTSFDSEREAIEKARKKTPPLLNVGDVIARFDLKNYKNKEY